jgi:hypothetical protein
VKYKGHNDNAVCPKCKTFTEQWIKARGVRECGCGEVFQLKDVERVQNGKTIQPKGKTE